MHKLLTKLDALLNDEQLLNLILSDPVKFSKTKTGKLLFRLYSMVPSKYDTSLYKLPEEAKAIKIVFTGMGDGASGFSKKHFKLKFPNLYIYFFGWPQLELALTFAKKIDRHQPVLVFGHSWGSNAAKDFIQSFSGNITKAYFLDPIRRSLLQPSNLLISKDIPIIYTPIELLPKTLNAVLHKVLRWRPTLNMHITLRVSEHKAINLWLDMLDDNNKKASTFKYPSYTLVLCKLTF